MFDLNVFWDVLKSIVNVFFKLCKDMLTNHPWLSSILIIIFITPVLFSWIINFLDEKRLQKSGMLEVDKMTGERFEKYLAVLFKARGYQVKSTPTTGDFGADLILSSNDSKIVVQAKRYKKNVGVKAIQEVVSAKSYYSANECWVVTNSNFTEPAKKLAASNQVKLIGRETLMKWMLDLKKTLKDNNSKRGA